VSSPESITRVEVRDEPRPGLRVAPARVGRYEIGHRLGQGGAGIVYSARDPELQRDVAVKIITLRSGAQDEAARLVREGQALAQLSHENVVRVFDVGFHDARTVYLVMEQLDGGDLRKWLATPRSVDEIVAACTAAGRGLAAVHAIGVVHRDFKPSNVLVGKDGRIAVGDFGLAKSFERAASSEPSERNSGESLRFDDDLTGTGSVVGTPAFMAPEQHTGGEVGPAADQFAFCVSFWLALFGTYPFEGRSLPELAANKLAGRIATAPRRSGVPRQVVAVLARGLAAQPEARHPGMDAMLSALADAFSVPRRRTGGLAIAAGVAWVLSAAACTSTGSEDRSTSPRYGTTCSAQQIRPC